MPGKGAARALPERQACNNLYGMRSVGLLPGLCPQKAVCQGLCAREAKVRVRQGDLHGGEFEGVVQRPVIRDTTARVRQRPCQAGERATQTLRA